MACLDLSDLPQQIPHDQQRIIDLSEADESPDKILLTYGGISSVYIKKWRTYAT